VTFQVTKKVRILWIKHINFYTHGKYTSHSIIMAVIHHYLMEKQSQKETKLNFELFVICLTNDLCHLSYKWFIVFTEKCSELKPIELISTPEGNMTISRVNKFSYLPYAREMNVLFHQANVLVNSAKWNLLAIFVYKIIISEHLWSYTVIWPKR
jgi:hypothetical protein